MLLVVISGILIVGQSYVIGYFKGYDAYEPRYIIVEKPVPFEVPLPIPIPLYAISQHRFVGNITVEEGLAIIEMARSSHQFYADNQELIEHSYGKAYEEAWIDRYNQLEDLIVKLGLEK